MSSLDEILSWIDSFNQKGYYRTPAIHPIWGVYSPYEVPHTFNYPGIILGYINLFERTGNNLYLSRAEEAGLALGRIQKSNGCYNYSSYEFDTEFYNRPAVIHNALPSFALLKLFKTKGKEKYLKIAKTNISFILANFWNTKYFSGCVNQDMSVCNALLELYSIENKKMYLDIAEKTAKFALKFRISEGRLKGSFKRGLGEENIVIPWYEAINAHAFSNLSEYTNNDKYFEIARDIGRFLIRSIENGKLIHSFKNDAIRKTPYQIAGLGYVYYVLKNLGMRFDDKAFIRRQHSGAFPNAEGYNDFRDFYPSLAWNAFAFLYLSSSKEIENRPKKVKIEKKALEINNKKIAGRINKKEGIIDFIKDDVTWHQAFIKNGVVKANEDPSNYVLRLRDRNGYQFLGKVKLQNGKIDLNVGRNYKGIAFNSANLILRNFGSINRFSLGLSSKLRLHLEKYRRNYRLKE